MKTLSIYIANYNHGKYLRRCLDSIVLQTRQPDQLVIVDDASTDESLSIIREYEAKYSYIEVHVHEKNKGAIASFQFVLSLLRGDYMYGVSADDYVMPNWFEKAMEVTEVYPDVGLIFGNVFNINAISGETSISHYRPSGKPYLLPEKEFLNFVTTSKFCCYMTCACMYRREAWESVGGLRTEIDHYADSFAANVVGMIYRACHVAHTAHAFTFHETSFSMKQMSKTQKMMDIAFEIEKVLQGTFFRDRITLLVANAWVKEMKRQAIDNPIWMQVMEKVKEREKEWKRIQSEKRSFVYRGGWWFFSRVRGQFWKINAKFMEIQKRIQWRDYRPSSK